MTVQALAGDALVVAGGFLFVAAALGLVRLPDAYNRTNAVAKAATLGVALVLAGVAVLEPGLHTGLTLGLAMVAQLFTAPISAHAVGRAAYRSKAPVTPATHRDDLAGRR